MFASDTPAEPRKYSDNLSGGKDLNYPRDLIDSGGRLFSLC
jgi:hypothetical protein